jgi:type VI protein secretion system component VasF
MDGRDASRIENALIQAAQLLAATSERLAQAENTTQAESAKIQTRLIWLTGVMAAAGFLQALAIGWSFFAWWLQHKGPEVSAAYRCSACSV